MSEEDSADRRMNAAPRTRPAEDRPPDLREIARALWGQKWLILAITLASLVAVVLATLSQPKIYSASCSIEYDPNPVRPLGAEIDDVADPGGDYWSSREFFETQNQILRSRTIAERVVRQFGLERDPSFFAIPEGERRTWEPVTVEQAAQVLQTRVLVEQERDSRIVRIQVMDQRPERAQLLANAIADAYIEKTLEDRLGSSVNALDWLNGQLQSLRGDLERSEVALHEFKIEHNVLSVSLEDSQNIIAGNIERFNEELAEARVNRIQLEAHVRSLRVAMEGDTLDVNLPELSDSQTLSALRSGYRAQEAELESLSRDLGPAHPRIVALQARLEALREQMRTEIRSLVAGAEADLREARTVETGLETALEAAHRQGLELNMREIEYTRLDRERSSHEKLYSVLLERSAETDLTRALRVSHVRIIDRALRPTEPVSPRMRVNASLGGLVGLLAGVLAAFALTRLDRRIRTTEQLEALGAVVVGVLPTIEESVPARRKRTDAPPPDRDLVVHHAPMSAAAECCRGVRTNLVFMGAARRLRSFVVTSAGPREGKTTVAANLAITFAQSGRRVLIVDTDLRRPRVHRTFGLANDVGVSSIIVGEKTLAQAVRETEVPNLSVLTCGPVPPNPAELLHHELFKQLVSDATDSFDIVVFDSPPLGPVTDAAIIAPQVDGTLLVVKADQTSRDAVSAMLRQLRDVNANVLGFVLNGVDLTKTGSYSGYYYRRDGYAYAPDHTST